MRLTRYTDYSLRVLMYLAAKPDRLASIGEISEVYGISRNHLMKVVQDLVRVGFVASVRGRNGGIRLARAPDEINIGAVVRATEDSFQMAPCDTCVIAPACGLRCALEEAVRAFLTVLDAYTLTSLPERDLALADLFPELPEDQARGGRGEAPRRE
jgi:Rrf2 family transcriptional regulator, nitric oxide-sensitive transcriptional repressor